MIELSFNRRASDTKFMAWCDQLHPRAYELFWNSSIDLHWDAVCSPDYKATHAKPTDDQIQRRFPRYERLIRQLGVTAHIDWLNRDLIIEVPESLYVKKLVEMLDDFN